MGPSRLSLGNSGDPLVVTFYGTGLRNNSGLTNSSITIGGARASLLYVGAPPQYPGLDQVNAIVPASLAGAGEVPVVLTGRADGECSHGEREIEIAYVSSASTKGSNRFP
jgi:uncharacterized protein (TIGR03437 family)